MEKMFQLEAVRPAGVFAQFNPAHLGFVVRRAGGEKILNLLKVFFFNEDFTSK